MNKELIEFLKSKGVKMCFASGKPFPVQTNIPFEWLEEYYNYKISL